MKKYDYIILGTGPAGYLLAKKIAKTSKTLLAVEGGLFGGTCPNVGCEPKIFLEGAVHTALQSEQLAGRGLVPAKIDWDQLMKTKKARFDSWPEETREIYQKMCDVAPGYGKFVAPHVIEVNGKQYQGENIIIATGHRPHRLMIPGHEFTHDSSDVLSLEKLPKHVVFFGGGYVGIELATFLAAAGSRVDIVVRHDKILRGFYQKYTRVLIKELEKRNIHFYFNCEPTEIKKDGEQYQIALNNEMGTITANYIVDATGRVPNLEKLNLQAAKIDFNKHGVSVDQHLETNVAGVYAIGDITNQKLPKLTTVAELEAEYLFNRLEKKAASDFTIPTIATACFAFPQIAQAGINPDNASKDSDYQLEEHDLSYSSNYAGLNDNPAKLTIVYNKRHEIVGASEISSSAADDINYLTPVIGLKLNKDNWQKHVLEIYPALADKIAGLLI